MWMVEDALEGRTTIGRSRDGRENPEVLLRLSGKQHYQLEKFLQEAAEEKGNYFRTRMAVLLAEAVRTQVECYGGVGEDTAATADKFTAGHGEWEEV